MNIPEYERDKEAELWKGTPLAYIDGQMYLIIEHEPKVPVSGRDTINTRGS